MKSWKTVTFILITAMSSLVIGAEVTPMELRIMQSRLFEKTPAEVETAITELCGDYDLLVMGSLTNKGMTCLQNGMPPDVKASWAGEPIFPENSIFMLQFRCAGKCVLENTKVAVRMRAQLFESGKNIAQSKYQPKTAGFYSPWFNAIDEYLFIEAIDWSPDIQY